MNEAREAIARAFAITDRMSVSGNAVEQMAALRKALRDAFAALEKGEETDGKAD